MSPIYALWLSLLVMYLVITGRAEIAIDRLITIFQGRNEGS